MSKASLRRRVTATLSSVLALALGLTMAGPAWADTQPVDPSDPRTPVTFAADALPTVQIDGVVWQQVTVGNTVYAAGSFQNARPAGAAPGTNLTPRTNLLAYDITTGNLITSFNHTLNGQVLGITKSPDGKRIYITGDFTQVDGQWRVRVAGFDTATGALIAGFRPTLASRGYAVAATNDTVYVGGNFTSVASVTGGTLQNAPYLAAFDAATGAIKTGFTGSADGPVLALTVPPAAGMVAVGGRFATLSGQAIRGLGAVDPATGAALSFPTNQFIWASGSDAAVLSLSSDEFGIYGTAYHFGSGGNLEGPFRADPVTGELIWVADCHGDTYSAYRVGDAVYTASHQHYCGNVPDGFPQTDPWTFHYATAFSLQPTGVNTPDIYGYPDHPGQPAPSLLTWYPLMYAGTYTGQGQAGWSVTGTNDYLSFGGEFTAVNTSQQQGLVRYAKRELAPNKLGPRLRGADTNPTLLSLAAGTVRVSWPENWDRDNETLTYRVYRQTQNGAPVFEKSVTRKEWQRGTMGFVDTGLTPGSSVRYRVTVSDPYNNLVQSEWITTTVATGAAGGAYSQAVIGDGASTYWRLGEPSGTANAYDWAGFNDGVVGSGVTRGTAGGVGDADQASTFDGTQNGLVVSPARIQGPDVFSVEAWFRTTSTAGGKIIGFGNANTGNSSNYDRHVYMEPDGRVTFGVWTGQAVTVSSAPGLNDGQWHHVVASLGPNGEQLFVDGIRVGARTDVSAGQAYQGYWRVGGDSSWAGANYFAGDIDDVAIYPTVLSYQQVVGHWVAAGHTSALPPVPADAYGAAVQALEPDLYWRLDETSGTVAADTGWSASPGGYRSGYTLGRPGAFGTGTAVQLDGVSGLVSSDRSYANPRQYSEELWFSTTTTAGGKLIGFGRSATGLSSSYDRHVYMESDGRLTFGVWTGQMNTTTSPLSYNDGQWHHLVATQSADGMKLYVDGLLVGSNPQTGAENYTGYWRVGGDNNWGPGQYFAGSVDEVAIYPFALSGTQVAQHFTLGGGLVNLAPTAAISASTSGLTAQLSGTGSSDPDGTIASYAWDFGDGSPAGTGATVAHAYAAAGTYTVTLTVTDNGGKTGTTTAPVTVTAPPANQSPTAVIGSTVTNLSVAFSGTGSSDPDGTVTSYAWAFGDGATSTQASPTHAYAAAGTYTVTLVVTDNQGATGTATADVTVTAAPPVNQSPVASATLTPTGLVVAANGTASSDPDGTIASYAWDFGDGTPVVTGATTSHTYTAGGSYTVTLVVTDNQGATGTTTVPVTVTAPNQLPTASFTATPSGLGVSVDATASSDPDGTIASYAWTFGDGGAATGITATHTYATAGSFDVTLTVTDNRGGQASTTHTVVVTAPNQPPVVDFTANAAGLVATFAATAIDPDGVVSSYAWTFGDAGTSNEINPTHTYAAAGTYPVTLTVTDDKGATAVASRSVTVTSPGVPATVASDAFGRSLASGWGAADIGGTWSLLGAAANYQVAGGVGVERITAAGSTRTARLDAIAATDTDTRVDVSVDKAQTGGGTFVNVTGRRVGTSVYDTRLKFLATGVVNVSLMRDAATLANVNLAGTYTPGTALSVRLQVVGTSPTTLALKVWRAGQSEPAGWQLQTTDSTAGLQTSGAVALTSYLTGSSTSAPMSVSFDNLVVTSSSATPPANQAPVASFVAATTGRSVSVDASASSDPEGAPLGYAWTFGDGGAASGVTAGHTYAADGTYTVTLVVTDAGGLTSTTTRSVTVAAPVIAELATDTFARTVAAGWGSAEVGGSWSVVGTASAFKVDAGVGQQVVPRAGATLTAYLAGLSATSADVSARVSVDQAVTGGGTYLSVVGRRVGSASYSGRVKLLATGAVQVQAMRDSTALAQATVAGLAYTPGTQLQVRVRVTGTSPTTVQVKVWPVGQAEPVAWQVSTTDATAGLQSAGGVGLGSYVSGSSTTVPTTVRWDELHVTAP